MAPPFASAESLLTGGVTASHVSGRASVPASHVSGRASVPASRMSVIREDSSSAHHSPFNHPSLAPRPRLIPTAATRTDFIFPQPPRRPPPSSTHTQPSHNPIGNIRFTGCVPFTLVLQFLFADVGLTAHAISSFYFVNIIHGIIPRPFLPWYRFRLGSNSRLVSLGRGLNTASLKLTHPANPAGPRTFE